MMIYAHIYLSFHSNLNYYIFLSLLILNETQLISHTFANDNMQTCDVLTVIGIDAILLLIHSIHYNFILINILFDLHNEHEQLQIIM